MKHFWDDYGLLVLLCASILLFLVMAIVRWGMKGTYDHYVYLVTKDDLKVKRKKKVNFEFDRSSSSSIESSQESASDAKESKLEKATREALFKIFGKPFNKIRPNFLNNPVTGGKNNLEIDCYNEELRLGVEVQGQQHYKYTPYFHKNYEAFMNQKYRDELKRRMCKDNGITLIEVPYSVKVDNIEDFLRSEIKKAI